MSRHVDLLATLYLIFGALALVTGLAIVVLGLGALAVVSSAQRVAYQGGLAAGLTAITFFTLGIGGLLWGGAHILTGIAARKRRHWARLVGLGLAVLNLFFLPFGTALAVYAFWVLLNNDARQAFAPVAKTEPAS